MTSTYDPRYRELLARLAQIRKEKGMTQADLSRKVGFDQQPLLSKIETAQRRIDVVELLDILKALDYKIEDLLSDLGWMNKIEGDETSIAQQPENGKEYQPIRLSEIQEGNDLKLSMTNGVSQKIVTLNSIKVSDFKAVESLVEILFTDLNNANPTHNNREAIAKALESGISTLAEANPSDIYHHIIYRLYLRYYMKSNAKQSWVRAGGEALELFLEKHYNAILAPFGIKFKWLKNKIDKSKAMEEIGISGKVGGSKLDISLSVDHNGKEVIFGGIHVKASLAERVSDDIPCSRAMMSRGFASILVTFDAKSYPEKDLVNRGELGTITSPSDKRKYIEDHGDFSACFSYNTRTEESPLVTPSGKRIVKSVFGDKDVLPKYIVLLAQEYIKNLK